MFNIFSEEGGQMTDNTQMRKIFSRVQHPQLQDNVKAIEVRPDLDCITYSEATNQLKTFVSKMPEYQLSLKVSLVQASGGDSVGQEWKWRT